MTVSRTLRGEPTVDEQLRRRVLDAVDELGYRRNDWARGLRSGSSTGLLGLVITNLGNPFYSQLATGVEEVAAGAGLQLVLGTSADDPERERALVSGLAARRVEGLIVVPTGIDHGHLQSAHLHDLPVVVATSPAREAEVDAVTVDDFGGAREAARRLLLEGHRRVAFLGLSHETWTGHERLRGFLAGHQEFGIDPGQELIIDLSAEDAAADAQLWRLMAGSQPPTAVFAANNRNTVTACRWVQNSGDRLRIIGFDDIATAPLFSMPLSLVSYSPAEIGRRAAELLMERIRGEVADRPRRVVVATSLTQYGVPDAR